MKLSTGLAFGSEWSQGDDLHQVLSNTACDRIEPDHLVQCIGAWGPKLGQNALNYTRYIQKTYPFFQKRLNRYLIRRV